MHDPWLVAIAGQNVGVGATAPVVPNTARTWLLLGMAAALVGGVVYATREPKQNPHNDPKFQPGPGRIRYKVLRAGVGRGPGAVLHHGLLSLEEARAWAEHNAKGPYELVRYLRGDSGDPDMQRENSVKNPRLSYPEEQALKAETLARWKGKTFGLRGFPGDTFRVSTHSSYVNDHGVMMLYTERRNDKGQWVDFAKGTEVELERQMTNVRDLGSASGMFD
jgi:hypothetical protein